MNIAKGRTNIELRERFILADGVSQGMVAFKSKPLVNPKTGEINSVGPITKVCKSNFFNIHLNLMKTVYFIDLTQYFVKLSDNIFFLTSDSGKNRAKYTNVWKPSFCRPIH